MDELIQGFMDEANDLIGNLEEALLVLESNPNDEESIASVFRVMHTLKGSGSMFGFTSVTSFTHLLENIYDKIRSGKVELSKEILNLTFESVDLIKSLMQITGDPEGAIKEEYDRQVKLFGEICERKESTGITKPTNNEFQEISSNKPSNNSIQATYYIHFSPHDKIMQNGTNPLYLIDELIDLGEGIVFAHTNKIPDYQNIEPQICYSSWDIVLTTEVDLSEILDVFIFVEDDSLIDIQKISDINLLLQKSFTDQLPKYIGTIDDSAIVELQELAEQIEDEININEPSTEVHQISNESKDILEKTPQQNIQQVSNDQEANDTEGSDGQKTENIKKEVIKLTKASKVPQRSKTSSSIRVSSKKVETLINLVSEMVTTQARLNLLAKKTNDAEILEATESLEKLTRQLRDNAFEISLIPISSLVTRFQRLIRDLSKELNKNVSFIAEGTDTELDKTIIESLSDPLMHIFRNAIDHGMENKEERLIAGKPEMGILKFKAYYSGTSVYIDISDDGKGINTKIVRQKAIEKGLISKTEKLNDQQIHELILLPGFSTASSVTDISGRGVGMDVVKKNINKIQGEVEIFSEEGKGTTFSLKLPLTLSIIDGLLVHIDDNEYIIPILVINKIKPIKHQEVINAFNNVITVDQEQIPFIYLREKFNSQTIAPEQEEIVVVSYANKSVGIIIDRVIRESQVVVKSIGKHFQDQEMVSGASIMGDGSVALVLDTNKIIDKYSR